MNPALTKRPRGRPPKDPSKLKSYRQRTVRLRLNGTPAKRPKRVRDSAIETWLRENQDRFWSGRGRPPKGVTQTLTEAVTSHFGITNRTLLRVLARIQRQQRRNLEVLTLDPVAAAMAQAMTGAYHSRSPQDPAGPVIPKTASQPQAQTGPTSKGPRLAPRIDLQSMQATLLNALSETPDLTWLASIKGIIDRRLPRQATNDAATAAGLAAIGLRVVPGSSTHRPVPKTPSPVDLLRHSKDSLLEALAAYQSIRRIHTLAKLETWVTERP